MMLMTDYFPPHKETIGERLQRIIYERQSKAENRKARRQRQHERKKIKKFLRDC